MLMYQLLLQIVITEGSSSLSTLKKHYIDGFIENITSTENYPNQN